MPNSYTVLYLIARLDDEEIIRRLDDGSIHAGMTAKDLDKGKVIEAEYTEVPYEVADEVDDDVDDVDDDEGSTRERTGRGKSGKGAGSKADPKIPDVSRDVFLAEHILQAALDLYDYSNEAVKVNVNGAVDRALAKAMATLCHRRKAMLAGLRYAVELVDVVEEAIEAKEAAGKSPEISAEL